MKNVRIAVMVVAMGLLGGMVCRMVAQDKAPTKYDVAAQKTVEGIVEEIKDYKCPVTGTVGSHITLKTATGNLEIHLGPAAFLKDYQIVLHQGDDVSIVGAKFSFEGHPAMLAKSLTIDRVTYTFRDDKGLPLW